MIEKCNFKTITEKQFIDNDKDGKSEFVIQEKTICQLTNGMVCPGEMSCIVYMTYFDEEGVI